MESLPYTERKANWIINRLPEPLQRLLAATSRTEKVIAVILLGGVLFSATFSIILFVRNHTELVPQPGGSYREAAVGQPRHLNPIVAGASDVDLDINRLIYDGLFKLNKELQLEPNLATGYEISDDQKTYTVKIRRGVTWHDGEPLKAEDVVFTIRSIQTPDYSSPLATAFEGVNVEALDEETIAFTLQEPYASFPASLTVGIVPQHVWQEIAPKNVTLAEQILKPVGTGPYKFSEITTRKKTGNITALKTVRNDNYHGPRPLLDDITFFFFTSHEEVSDALTSGAVDGAGFLPLDSTTNLANSSEFNKHQLRLPQYFGLFFNQSKHPALADAGVRNALELGTNRELIVSEALGNEGDPQHLALPDGFFDYQEELPSPNYDLEAAKQNLEDAGWKDEDGDGIRSKDDKELRLTITTTEWPEYRRTAESIQKQWAALGVAIDIESYGPGVIQQIAVRPRNYQILLFGEILSSEPDPYPFWHSTQTRDPGLNFALLKDDQIDKLLEEARKITDRTERGEKYREFQSRIFELKPAIILYRPHYLFITTTKVRGIDSQFGASPSDRFNNIAEWHVRTKRVWK